MVHRHWDDKPEPLVNLGLLILAILLIVASL